MSKNRIERLFDDLNSKDDKLRYSSFQELMMISEEKVDWVYDYWSDLLSKLKSDNSYQRSIGIMLLANISKSDYQNYSSQILGNFFQHFNDKKFICSRQTIQCVWKLAVHSKENQDRIAAELEKNWTSNIHLASKGNLIKKDILTSLFNIYKQSDRDKQLLKRIKDLIELEKDEQLKKSLNKIISSD